MSSCPNFQFQHHHVVCLPHITPVHQQSVEKNRLGYDGTIQIHRRRPKSNVQSHQTMSNIATLSSSSMLISSRATLRKILIFICLRIISAWFLLLLTCQTPINRTFFAVNNNSQVPSRSSSRDEVSSIRETLKKKNPGVKKVGEGSLRFSFFV